MSKLPIVPKEVVRNTLVDYPRLYALYDYILETKSVKGEVAEVGVYKGGTALWLALNLEAKSLYLFDTFEGMPKVDKTVDLHNTGDFADTSLDYVYSVLFPILSPMHIHKGVFPQENSQYIANNKFSLVHLDVDIYSSVYDCLTFFTPRMSPGGIIVLDDYLEPNCPGAKLAADKFCKENNLTVTPSVQSQAIIRF